MSRIRIDFAAPGVRRALHLAPIAHWLLALAAFGLCVGAAWAISARLGQQRLREALVRQAYAGRTAAPAPPRKVAIPPAQAAAVNAAVLQLNLPWRELAEAVEAATPATVALLALEPDPKTRTLHLMAEARTSDDMLTYIQRLKQQPLFVGATLTRHEVNEQDPNRPLRFQLDVQWSAPGTVP